MPIIDGFLQQNAKMQSHLSSEFLKLLENASTHNVIARVTIAQNLKHCKE
jgi:hypothetical protein